SSRRAALSASASNMPRFIVAPSSAAGNRTTRATLRPPWSPPPSGCDLLRFRSNKFLRNFALPPVFRPGKGLTLCFVNKNKEDQSEKHDFNIEELFADSRFIGRHHCHRADQRRQCHDIDFHRSPKRSPGPAQ